jgi:hypothetical protein
MPQTDNPCLDVPVDAIPGLCKTCRRAACWLECRRQGRLYWSGDQKLKSCWKSIPAHVLAWQEDLPGPENPCR